MAEGKSVVNGLRASAVPLFPSAQPETSFYPYFVFFSHSFPLSFFVPFYIALRIATMAHHWAEGKSTDSRSRLRVRMSVAGQVQARMRFRGEAP